MVWGQISRHEESPLSYAHKLRQQNIISEVRNAVVQGHAIMAYQPVVVAHDTDKIAFYEALIRIVDANGLIIPAGDFIDEVETTETGRMIDCLALESALQCLTKAPDLKISVNMSARSIGYLRWTRILERALRRDPRLGERLILEVTEQSAIVVPELVSGFMTSLQNMGVRFALDDFGSGFTSLRYLKEFYFDILKIDGSFIKGVSQNADNQIITRSIINIAQEFGMITVAEHIENNEDCEFLQKAGVDFMQGYYFGAPSIKPRWAATHDPDSTPE